MRQGLHQNLVSKVVQRGVTKNVYFTLYAGERQVVLVASSKDQCVEWLRSIHRILMSSGDTTPRHLRSGSQSQSRNSLSTTEINRVKKAVPRKLKPEELEAIVTAMGQGMDFFLHSDDQDPLAVFVTFSALAGKEFLQWTVNGAKERGNQTQRLLLRTVSDIYVGKRSSAFRRAKQAKHERCFSLVSSVRMVNLEATDAEQANDWVSAIHATLTRTPEAPTTTSKPTPDPGGGMGKIMRLMEQGNEFVRYFKDAKTQQCVQQKIHLFYERGSGAGMLYWCRSGERVMRENSSFPLAGIREMTIGKQTPVLKMADKADHQRCFSLIGHDSELNLEAETRGKLAVWLNGIHRILTTDKSFVSKPVKGQEEQPMQITKEAHVFTRYEEEGPRGLSTKVMIWYAAQGDKLGSLYWSAPNATKQRVDHPDRCLPLSSITEMCLGKQASAFSLPVAAHADKARCFSLFSRTVNLNLEAPSSKERTAWLNEIHRLLTQSGGMKPCKVESRKVDSKLQQAIDVMRGGGNFVLYETDAAGSITLNEVTLFYDTPPSGPEVGRLYWCAKGLKDQMHEQSIQVDHICEMTSGRQTKTFVSLIGSKADAEKCFSLHTPNIVLNLEAPTKDIRSTWLNAIHSVLTKLGRKRSSSAGRPSRPPGSLGPLGGVQDLRPRSGSKLSSATIIRDLDPMEIFQVIALIGQGTYGSVYKARDRRDGKVYGLKLLDMEGGEGIEIIQREIDILKDCMSEFIVALRGVYSKDTKIWIAMEYCAAGSLSDMMTICKRTLTERQISCVLKMSLQGLGYLHSRKVIHRDIKAANILVNDQGKCKLADFGVSAEMRTTLTRKQTLIGTPNWMAPEVIKASKYDFKADIWSLGITAIELACGHPPHWQLHPMTAMFKIPTSPPPTLPKPEKWSKDFHDFIKKSLVMDPKERPDAPELLEHPFIQNAAPIECIQSFVSECMVYMDSHRELDQLNQDPNRMFDAGESPMMGSTMSYR